MRAVLATPGQAIAPHVFRDAMARLAASVHIVTTTGEHGDGGITATAVCSVTDTPGSMLVCLNKKSRTHDLIMSSGVLAINMLGEGQEELAAIFAGQRGMDMADRFLQGCWTRMSSGAPILVDAIASMDCVVSETVEAGTHRIFICRVSDLLLSQNTGCLVYGLRRFVTVDFSAEPNSRSVPCIPSP